MVEKAKRKLIADHSKTHKMESTAEAFGIHRDTVAKYRKEFGLCKTVGNRRNNNVHKGCELWHDDRAVISPMMQMFFGISTNQ